MRITRSDNYAHGNDCPLSLCDRHYCSEHRLLWRDCDTAKAGLEGDSDVVGGTRAIFEMGDCPECEYDYRQKKIRREMEAA